MDRNLWEEARWLRQQGWSLRRIARHLDYKPRYEPLRWCSRCSRLRGESQFNRLGSGGLQWWCRDCFKSYYEEKRAHPRRRSNALKTKRVQAAQALVLEYLRSHPCCDCGERDPVVLEFDHVGPKRAEVATLVRRGVRTRVLMAEIDECEVVCANCHRRRTARRHRWRRLDRLSQGCSWRSKAHERNVLYAVEVLAETGCIDCGERDVRVLEFDHVGAKTGGVMTLARREVGLARLKAEIEQCEVRCVNCHRQRTSKAVMAYRTHAGIPPARVELALRD